MQVKVIFCNKNDKITNFLLIIITFQIIINYLSILTSLIAITTFQIIVLLIIILE